MAIFEAAQGAGIINRTLVRLTRLFSGRRAVIAPPPNVPHARRYDNFIGAGFQPIDPSSIEWVSCTPIVPDFQFQPIGLSICSNWHLKPTTLHRQLGSTTDYRWSPPARWAENTQQARVSSFPAEIQQQAALLYEASLSGLIIHEHWSIILILEDGSTIPLLDATDGSPNQVTLPENANKLRNGAIEEARRVAAARQELFKGVVRVVSLHTHPAEGDSYYEKTEEGDYYTALSRDDYRLAEREFLYNLVRRLRAAGFSGRIETLNGALPVTRDLLPRGVAASIYIVFYFQWLARLHGYIVPAAGN
jgi:hypothetical protein